jgi:hypothetical protein
LEDIAAGWPDFRDKLVVSITNNTYSLSPVDVIDLPKDPLNVRPLARLALKDRLFYDACVLAMTPTIDAAIPDNVYSYRWSKYKQRLYSPISRWIKMQQRGRRCNRRNQELLLLRTDITAFYEYVDIDTLVSDLRAIHVPAWALSLLEYFLREFNDTTHAWGLPQGPDSSGVLSNLYLLQVDKFLRRDGFTHLRYSDDIMVFGPSWSELRKMLLQINHIYRSRHLSLSASKTKIVPANKVAQEFEDTSKDAVRYNIDVAASFAGDALRKYFDEAISSSPMSVRDLRFALNQLRRVEDDYAVAWLLENLGDQPDISREAIRYLQSFISTRTEIGTELSSMLANRRFGFYPSVERQIINLLVLDHIYEPEALDACWRILEDANQSVVRDFAARYVGKFCHAGDGSRLRGLFERESSEEIRRALLVSYFESGNCPERLLRSLARSNSRLGMTARYLQLSPSTIPCPDLKVRW